VKFIKANVEHDCHMYQLDTTSFLHDSLLWGQVYVHVECPSEGRIFKH